MLQAWGGVARKLPGGKGPGGAGQEPAEHKPMIYFLIFVIIFLPSLPENLQSISCKLMPKLGLPEKITARCQYTTMTRNYFIFHKNFKVKKYILFSELL